MQGRTQRSGKERVDKGQLDQEPGDGGGSGVMTPERRAAMARALRKDVPLESHAELTPAAGRDAVAMLQAQDFVRVADLVPIRYGRMSVSPFTFFRGAARVMAADLATTPTSGLTVQLCGDAHLSNFGAYASADRRLVFDIHDFDETFPGSFEWDVKRLATSFVVAGRSNGLSDKRCRKLARSVTETYRSTMRDFAQQPILAVWYARLDIAEAVDEYLASLAKPNRKRAKAAFTSSAPDLTRASTRNSLQAIRKLTAVTPMGRRIVSNPPLVIPLDEMTGLDPDQHRREVTALLSGYRETLQSDRRHLLDHFTITDIAHKIVGVGSVGLRAWIILLEAGTESEGLLLQAKQAVTSVLAEHTGDTTDREQGARVVAGQRIMQASSDIFLGWLSTDAGNGGRHDYYLRQLRDWKVSAEIDQMTPQSLAVYGRMCGWTLARAHARSGDRIAIAAYLGSTTAFDHAVADFAVAYADQNDRDYEALSTAIADGEVTVTHDI